MVVNGMFTAEALLLVTEVTVTRTVDLVQLASKKPKGEKSTGPSDIPHLRTIEMSTFLSRSCCTLAFVAKQTSFQVVRYDELVGACTFFCVVKVAVGWNAHVELRTLSQVVGGTCGTNIGWTRTRRCKTTDAMHLLWGSKH